VKISVFLTLPESQPSAAARRRPCLSRPGEGRHKVMSPVMSHKHRGGEACVLIRKHDHFTPTRACLGFRVQRLEVNDEEEEVRGLGVRVYLVRPGLEQGQPQGRVALGFRV